MAPADLVLGYIQRYGDPTYGSVVVNWAARRDGKVLAASLSETLRDGLGLPDVEARAVIDGMIADGRIVGHPIKGGFSIRLAGASPVRQPKGNNRREMVESTLASLQ